jgi:hypothetical protein
MTACLVYLVGEGSSDIGDLAKEPRYRENREGFFQPLLRTISAGRVPLNFEGRKLQTFPKNTLNKPSDLLGRKASQALALAGVEGARALVLATDTDKEQGVRATPREAKSTRQRKLQVIEEGFSVARKRPRACLHHHPGRRPLPDDRGVGAGRCRGDPAGGGCKIRPDIAAGVSRGLLGRRARPRVELSKVCADAGGGRRSSRGLSGRDRGACSAG